MKLEDAIKSNKFRNETQKAGLNVLYTAWWLKTIGTREMKVFDLTHEQYNVMRILKGKHPEKMCVKDIAGRMIEKSSNVPRIIDRLELKEFVQRTQGEIDGRQTVINLTEKGITTLSKATEKLNATWEEAISMNDEDAKNLSALLEKMRTKE